MSELLSLHDFDANPGAFDNIDISEASKLKVRECPPIIIS